MIEPLRNDLFCATCNDSMHFSCRETEEPGFVHEVFECPKCRSTLSHVAPERPTKAEKYRRVVKDRRSDSDTRSEMEKQLTGERRSGIARRTNDVRRASVHPSSDQLSLFAKRVRRAMRDDRGRHSFGVASGDGDFTAYADVLRSLEWIEDLARNRSAAGREHESRISMR
jgi:hypothetical protein